MANLNETRVDLEKARKIVDQLVTCQEAARARLVGLESARGRLLIDGDARALAANERDLAEAVRAERDADLAVLAQAATVRTLSERLADLERESLEQELAALQGQRGDMFAAISAAQAGVKAAQSALAEAEHAKAVWSSRLENAKGRLEGFRGEHAVNQSG